MVPHPFYPVLRRQREYGVGIAYNFSYTCVTTDHEFTRNQFIVVLIAPLVADRSRRT